MPLYHTAALEYALRLCEKQMVILDRWWPSEKLYANVFRGGQRWPNLGRILDRVALKHGVTYVMCLPYNKKEYLSAFDKLKETRAELFSNMRELYDAYEEFYTGSEWLARGFKRYDYFYDGSSSWIPVVIAGEAYDRTNAKTLSERNINERSIAGDFSKAKVLLIGEQSNQKTRRPVWPFFELANSSEWLHDSLSLNNIPEHQLAWANAFDAKTSEPNTKLISQLLNAYPHLSVVPMGIPALRFAEKTLGVKVHMALKHPQHSRRFEPNNRSGYKYLAEHIKELG